LFRHIGGRNEEASFGGGGFCPALTQGVWLWGNTDDVLFRLVTLGSADLEKSGFERIQYGTVHAGMPQMGFAVKTSDDLWKIIAFIGSINPPGANPPQKKGGPREVPAFACHLAAAQTEADCKKAERHVGCCDQTQRKRCEPCHSLYGGQRGVGFGRPLFL
jgi:hypothetical protein